MAVGATASALAHSARLAATCFMSAMRTSELKTDVAGVEPASASMTSPAKSLATERVSSKRPLQTLPESKKVVGLLTQVLILPASFDS